MKICITYTRQENERAAAVLTALNKLFPFWSKTTPEKEDGYIHTYLRISEPLPERPPENNE